MNEEEHHVIYIANISYQRLWYESYSFMIPNIFQIVDESLFFPRESSYLLGIEYFPSMLTWKYPNPFSKYIQVLPSKYIHQWQWPCVPTAYLYVGEKKTKIETENLPFFLYRLIFMMVIGIESSLRSPLIV